MLDRRSVLCVLPLIWAMTAAQAQDARPFPVGVTWVAESLAGKAFAQVSLPTLRLTPEGQAQGTSGCNRYTGAATLAASQITLGPLAMTRMACFRAGGDNERLFAPAIAQATAWRMEGRWLVIETARGALRFRRR